MADIDGRISIILKENFSNDGELVSRFDLIDKPVDKIGKNRVLVSKHWMVLGSLGLVSIGIIFVAALTVVYNAPKPGYFNESCSSRSCLSSLNLKCINKTCLCTSEQYYTKKCIDKKGYFEKCGSLTSHCKSNTNMICKDGVCKCTDTKYWNGTKCISKSNYTKTCTNDDQCYLETMVYCDLTKQKCLCPTER
jgi:hypothetical protein